MIISKKVSQINPNITQYIVPLFHFTFHFSLSLFTFYFSLPHFFCRRILTLGLSFFFFSIV